MQRLAHGFIPAFTHILNRPTIGSWLLFGRPSVGIYIGPLLGAQIDMRSPKRWANVWPNNVIVKLTVVPPLADGCYFGRPSVGICIGPMLGVQIGMRFLQRLINGWPNNVIVKLTVGPLQGPLVSPTMDQRSILES